MKPLQNYTLDLGGGTLLQLANRSRTQMMSYIIDCPEGGTIVIDGGMYCDEDADHLYRELEKRGKRVDLWFLTHCHIDHYGAFLRLAERADFDIAIGKLCFHFPRREWLLSKEDSARTAQLFSLLDRAELPIVTPHSGDSFSSGGITVEVLNEPQNYESYRSINPTGIILKAHFPRRSILFLGDFDVDAEADYRAHFSVEKLRCDIVQMAHHGQNGVSRDFYALIAPKYCLYPTPEWLWENRKGSRGTPETAGTGPFKTLETRLWMAEMRVIRSFHTGDGDSCFS
jgi:beta-lactamase superfamily II metal-dependent hydrolase